MSTVKIKQFKLTNDDEIICEVLETDTGDNTAILIRGALRVIESQDFERGIRFFGFRPWMSFNDDPKILQTINSGHIIGEITPEDKLIKIYMETINEINKVQSKKKKRDINVNALQDAMDNMSDEELDAYLDSHMTDEIYDPEVFSEDSQNSNVIHFKPKNTLH